MSTLFTINGLVYETINDNEVQLLKTEGLKRPVRNIPAEVEYSGKKYKVTEVYGGDYYRSFGYERSENGAFQKDDVLTNISLPETVKRITPVDVYTEKEGAFWGCKKLKDIYFPDSLEWIGSSAFKVCFAIESLYFGDNLKSISYDAFKQCIALKEIDFNDKLESIGNFAFEGCSSLKNVSFPESLKTISWGAFKGCKAMTEVNIPASVETIGSSAFAESGVKVVNIYSENINIAADAFPADAQINFLDANSFPKRKRKPRGAKNIEAPKATHASEEPAKPAQKEEKPKSTPKVVPVDMEKLIQAALVDGVVTDKERSILIKKVKEAGGDVDEFEMLLDARIFEATKKEEKPKVAPKAENTEAASPAVEETAKAAVKEPESPKMENTQAASPAVEETDEPTGNTMRRLHLEKGITVADLRKQFNDTFGAQVKLYNGNNKAEMTDTLGTLGLTAEGDFECRSSLTVASFIERMKQEYGLKVKVFTCDEWVAVLDGLTLESAGKVKKSATKADMESMIAYKRTDNYKKSATCGDYFIGIQPDNKVVITKGGEPCPIAKAALRDVAASKQFSVDDNWTTQQLGSKLVDFINGK